MNTHADLPDAVVYYDGGCPICRKEISHYRSSEGGDRVSFVDITTCSTEALGPDLSREAALLRMHVRLADGTLTSGAAAFVALWRQLPAFAWAGRLARLPLALPALEVGYQAWLKVRRTWRPL